MREKTAQIWVETVVYTLIGISIIGILLAVAKPKIDEMRDRVVIEQTIESFNKIHERILEIQRVSGNQRTLDFKLARGEIKIDGINNQINWSMESNYRYSQEGVIVSLGKIFVLTEISNPYKVTIFLDYTNEYNLTVQGQEKLFEIQESPTPYKILFVNRGLTNNKNNVNIEVN